MLEEPDSRFVSDTPTDASLQAAEHFGSLQICHLILLLPSDGLGGLLMATMEEWWWFESIFLGFA